MIDPADDPTVRELLVDACLQAMVLGVSLDVFDDAVVAKAAREMQQVGTGDLDQVLATRLQTRMQRPDRNVR